MNDSYIISKMNEYMFQLNQKMGKWLDKSLPQITNNWWQELVLNNLSSLQKDKVEKSNIRNVAGLDLASLLRVFERNWFVITSSFFVNNKEREKIRRMQEIRNDWAHITPQDINKKKVIDPLVIQAADYEANELPCEVGVTVSTDELPAGDYEFLIYVWRFVGLRPDVKLISVSDNEIVQKNILNYIQYSSEYDYGDVGHEAIWDAMDKLHYAKWQKEKEQYTTDVKNECEYRLEQLAHSFHQREAIFKNMLKNAEDDRIKRMRQSQLDKLTADFEQQKKKIDETIHSVDIYTNLQVKGILHVEG